MLVDTERRWANRKDRACRGVDTKVFFPDSGPAGHVPSTATSELWAAAKDICQNCPVLEECRRDTLGEDYGVWGGLDERERRRLRQALIREGRRWPKDKRLEWGKFLHDLRTPSGAPHYTRKVRMDWSQIRHLTGVPSVLGQELVAEYEEHLAAVKAERKTKVVDRPLPERTELPFPAKRGKRDLWVRHNGVVTDAFYKGESSDGRWIFVHIGVGRGHALKWIKAKDVRFHRDVPRYVISDKERAA
ncbi:WhiB family transcriptional regulator [Streptomyces halobius]|uniref:WhiB family transcriptional regulator n=1 Tax=Streptomyces halobius TaxID=2879846 RepID=UPI0024B16951|nr:WhiB family transcriptional regulator [Streptomyces halobius]